MSGYGWVYDPAGKLAVGGTLSTASVAGTSPVPVQEGDILLVQSFCDSSLNPAASDLIKDPKYGLGFDSLGNGPYTKVAYTNVVAATQSATAWACLITIPGVPTVTMQYNPTPGTSAPGSEGFIMDRLAGPGPGALALILDGTTFQNLVTPGTGTDALSSGNLTTKLRAGILVGMFQDVNTGAVIVAGTGFTTGAGGSGTAQNEFKTITNPSTVAATATCASGGTDTFTCIGFVIAWPLQYAGFIGSCQPNQLQYED